MDKRTLGKFGEDFAAAFLSKRGYRIIERNFRGRGGEIDLIAEHQRELVFIEVKTRTSQRFGNPEDAVDQRKIQHLTRAARDYLQQKKLTGKVTTRGDIVAVEINEKSPPTAVIFTEAIPLEL